MKKILVALLTMAMLGTASLALGAAQQAQQGQQAATPVQNSPAKVPTRVTSITVTHDGTDSLGTRLATRLKELYNTSNLFKLEEKNIPKIKIQINTKAEFTERPGMGSVYSVIWLFSQSDGHLGYLLASEVGTMTGEDIDELAYKIVERSDGLAVKYGYLFN